MDPAATAYLDQVRAAIQEHGWVIQATTIKSESGPPALLSYTAGMTAVGLPELMVLDSPTPWHSATTLNAAGQVHHGRPGGIPIPSMLLINGTLYAVTEMTPDIARCARVAQAIYGPAVRLLMLATAQNLKEAFDAETDPHH